MIILYESNSTEEDLKTQGLGGLPDAINPAVTEERNGPYTFEMQYPVKGVHFSDLRRQRIIKVKPNPYDHTQAFRIKKIDKPINGIVSVYAEHISYDLSGVPVAPFNAGSCAEALTRMKTNAIVDCPFDFWTDKTTTGTMQTNVPASLRSLLGGTQGSILDTYGKGEYEFDNHSVKLHLNRGEDRGVVLRYGKNITDIKQEENCANMATGVCGFWYNEDSGVVSQLVKIEGNFPYENILTVDFSSEWQDKPTTDQVKARIQKYIEENELTKPKISITVSFIDTPPTPEMQALSTVRLCDTVTVKFEKLGIDAKAKIIKTVYDVLNDRYSSIEIGDAKTNLVNTIAETQAKAKAAPTSSFLENAIAHAGKLIQGVLGGHVIIWNNATKLPANPNEILIMDTDDIKTAQNVWRWNMNGWGHSKTGYNGSFEMAATYDDGIIANYIKAGTLHGIQVLLGSEPIIKGSDGNLHFPVELNSDGTAYFAGEIHVGSWNKDTQTYAFDVTSEGAATCTNLTVVGGHIVGSDYNSLHGVEDKDGNLTDESSRMYLDSAALNFFTGAYIHNSDGSYSGDSPTGELKSDKTGVHLAAESGMMASLTSGGKNVFYTQDGEGYFGAAIHGNNNSLDGMNSVTANTFHGNLDGNASSANEANHASSADSADSASEANHASSSDSANEANHASSADSATPANSATSAGSAGSAVYAGYLKPDSGTTFTVQQGHTWKLWTSDGY